MTTPDVSSLPPQVLQLLQHKTELDHKLYKVVANRFRALVDAEGPSFAEELLIFRRLQAEIRHTCNVAAEHPACVWYKLNDLQFVRMIVNGIAPAVPFML